MKHWHKANMKHSLVARMKQSAFPQCAVRHTFFISRRRLHFSCTVRCASFKKALSVTLSAFIWLRELDSNQRPSGYEPDELPLLHPAIFVHSPECLYIITRSLMFVKRFTKKFYKKSKFPLKPLLSLCLSVIIYAAVP